MLRPLIYASFLMAFALGACSSPPRSGAAADGDAPTLDVRGIWAIEGLVEGGELETPPEGAKPPTIEFLPSAGAAGSNQGRVAGGAGVNRFFGTYAFSAGDAGVGALSIYSLGLTRIAGTPEAMNFEARVIEALSASRTVERDIDGLLINCGDVSVRLRPMHR